MTGRMFSCEIIPAISCVMNWDTYLSDPDSSKKYWSIRNIIVRNYVHPLMGGEYNAPIVFLRVVWGNSKGVSMAARLQRGTTPASCVTSVGTLTPFSNLSFLTSTQSLLYMVQHVADWVAPFPRSQHSSLPPLKILHTPPSPPPSIS